MIGTELALVLLPLVGPPHAGPASTAELCLAPAPIPALGFANSGWQQAHTPPAPRHSVYSPPTFSAGVLLGGRTMDNSSWEPVDDQGVLGFDFVARGLAGNHFGLEFGTMWSHDEVGSTELMMGEFYAGGRFTLLDAGDSTNRVLPYVSGGGTLIGGEVTQGNLSADDSYTAGYYFRAGIDFRVTPDFGIGLDYRHVGGTETDLEFGGIGQPNGDFDYDQIGLTFSFFF
jgi:hypothetical protein